MPDSSDIYNLTYGYCTHRVLAEIRRETFGEDIGQNSWSTADEYRQFIEWLQSAECRQGAVHFFAQTSSGRAGLEGGRLRKGLRQE